MKISGSTKVFAVIGHPVGQSLSPLIHNLWIEQAGLDAAYVALDFQSGTARQDIETLGRLGFSGLNVTLPHKIAALEAAISHTSQARRIGAANTLSLNEKGGWLAHNTDAEGFRQLLVQVAGPDLKGRKIVLIGAGGAARAAAAQIVDDGAELAIINRTTANAQVIVDEIAPTAKVADFSALERLTNEADIVVNSASFGHSGQGLSGLSAGHARPFIDLSYGKASRSVLKNAEQSGWTPFDGLPMLVGQAAASFKIWFDIQPDQKIAMEAGRAHLANRP